MNNSRIKTDNIQDMVEICTELTKEGILFETKFWDGEWIIEIKGY